MGGAIQSIVSSLTLSMPAIWLIVCGCLVLCGSLITPASQDAAGMRRAVTYYAGITLAILFVALGLSMYRGQSVAESNGLFVLDQTTCSCERVTLLGGVLVVLIGWAQAPRRFLPEYYGCLILLQAGTMLVGGANDLVTLYLGLELVSIPTYVLLSIVKSNSAGLESTMKYLLISVFSAGFFLLGASFLYGLSGTTELPSIHRSLGASGPIPTLALALVIGGLAFRITSFPFHSYVSDVFEGTSLTLAAALSYLPKVAGFAALIRLLGGSPLNAAISHRAIPILLVMSVTTMCMGNFLALAQTSLRRILAYSSMAHSGYLLLALASLSSGGQEPTVLFSYLSAYAAMTLGAFGCWSALEGYYVAGTSESPESPPEHRHSIRNIDDLSGQFSHHPFIVLMLTICLLSLIGLPLTGGFWAKLQVFISAIQMDRWDLRIVAIIMAFNAALAATYYLRLISKLFEPDVDKCTERQHRRAIVLDRHFAPVFAGMIAATLTVYWFFAPPQM